MTTTRRKVVAYVTHAGRLLVFSHPDFPDAGIQVPAGTVRDGEAWEPAALREATEETGLAGLEIVRYLGERWLDRAPYGQDEIHRRRFFHLRCTQDPPETWQHGEFDPSDGSEGPIRFDFFWAPLPDGVPELIAEQGALVAELDTAGRGSDLRD